MKTRLTSLTTFFAAASLVCCSAVTFATPLNTNIIVNGDAEASAGAPDFATTSAPSSWLVTSNFSAVQYAAGSAVDLNTADSIAVGGGTNYFAGGPSNASASAAQIIDISDLSAAIDAGSLTFALSALIGGFATQGDNMVFSATFLDVGAVSLGLTSLGPVTPADRSNESQLLARSANGTVPVGTRSIEIEMLATRLAGAYNDGYADNLSLVLRSDAVPVPTPTPVSLLGAAMLGWWVVRRISRA